VFPFCKYSFYIGSLVSHDTFPVMQLGSEPYSVLQMLSKATSNQWCSP